MTQQRLPLAPLLERFGGNMTALSRAIDVDPRQLHRDRDQGITVGRADRAATLLLLHPSLLWPEWWQIDAIPDGLTECAAAYCTERFRPRRKGHRFCSRRCAGRPSTVRGPRVCAAEDCPVVFTPAPRADKARYCCRACSKRMDKRVHRRDPAVLRAAADYQARYRVEVAEIIKRREQRRAA